MAQYIHKHPFIALRPLCDSSIPIFTNVNVRAEFLENHRRVLIAECLIDLFEDLATNLDGRLIEKLKAHRTSYRRKVNVFTLQVIH